MPLFLLVIEAKSKAPEYEPLLDVLERRLGAKRILRSAWVAEGESPEGVYKSIQMWFSVEDGLVIVPYGEPRVTKNLRD